MAEDFSASIEDYLVGLAASLQHAQRQLTELTVPGDSTRPSVSYQLPKLDFELKLSLEITEESSSSTDAGNGVVMRGRLLNATGTRAQSAEAASTIRGTFVAVPLSGGKPPPVLETALERIAPDRLAITATVRTATGEPLAGVEVHFNIDRRLGAQLNGGADSDQSQRPLPLPLHAVVTTSDKAGDKGNAYNVVNASGEAVGTRIPVTIDALGRTTTVVFTVEAPPDADGDGRADDEVVDGEVTDDDADD